jgi:amino acid adenylation domain-containing protein/non-ribosomal peptide synthase protein (TIGR01720 family)
MEKIINKNAELFWLNKFPAGYDEFTFPWEGEGATAFKLDVSIPAPGAAEIMGICKRSPQALLAFFVAGLSLNLHRYLNRQQLVICTSVQDEIVPLKMEVSGDSLYKNLLHQSKDAVSEALQYADYSFEQFLQKRRNRNKHANDAVFRKVLVAFNQFGADAGYSSDHDLYLFLNEDDGQLHLSVQFSAVPELQSVAENFINSYLHILLHTRVNLDVAVNDIDILSKSCRRKLLETFSPAPTNYGVGTVTDLFRQQVQSTPHNIALRHRDEQLSYAELWQRSSAVAHELMGRGVQPQQIVAILLDRSVEMITGLLGILQSGAAFLPIDPDYPEERIRHILSDSQSKFVITSKKYAGKFNEAVELVFVEDIQPGHTAELRMVAPGDLAYIIYTSGTTGLPNGVMISHQSLVNLCQWHKQYYGLTPADVSTKYAGFGFDATVWEIFPALLSGGSLYIIEDEIRYNLKALAENYTKHGVTISFLPTQLGEQFMQQETQCPSLQKLLLGGDKLKSMKPGLGYEVYNNYGPTENTVVATACKVAGDASNIPIGKPIGTSQVYVLLPGSEQLQPIGVAGELCISGDSLARGYLGKPELTARKFVANPFVAGKRMYRTGDLARWLPDGNLEFLGRIDNQIKIRGYRIEPGEIERTLVTHPLVKDAAVVKKDDGKSGYLCAFYTSDEPIEATQLTQFLDQSLPFYMVPSVFTWLNQIPVNANGKVDRALLAQMDDRLQQKPAIKAPETELERLMVKTWQEVLGTSEIGTEDNFFVLGGDSIKAIQIQSRLRTQGYVLKTRSIFQSPNIRELCRLTTGQQQAGTQAQVSGTVPLTPIQLEFFGNENIRNKNHFNQAIMLEFDRPVDAELVKTIFQKLIAHHDALRMIYKNGVQDIKAEAVVDLREYDEQVDIQEKCNEAQASVNIEEGPLVKLVLFQRSKLLVLSHHLVVDGVSWRILLEDIETLYQQAVNDQPLQLPAKSDAFKLFAEQLTQYASSHLMAKEEKYWAQIEQTPTASLFGTPANVENLVKDTASIEIELDEVQTASLLQGANHAYGTEINHLLLAALGLGFRRACNVQDMLVWLEGHGREELFNNIDISRTVGWFTTVYPLALQLAGDDIAGLIIHAKDTINTIPNKGIGYGIRRYLRNRHAAPPTKELVFNYLGQFDSDISAKSFKVSNDLVGQLHDPLNHRDCEVEMLGMVVNGKLQMSVKYHPQRLPQQKVQVFAAAFKTALTEIIAHCSGITERITTASDFTYKQLPAETVAAWVAKQPIDDIYELSPAQEGMLFHHLLSQGSPVYHEQVAYSVQAQFKPEIIESALAFLFERYGLLRTCFYSKDLAVPVQVVLKERRPEFRYVDLSAHDEAVVNHTIREYLAADKCRGFNLADDVLFRLCVFKTSDGCRFVWSYHHILMDGWCVGIISTEFYRICQSLLNNQPVNLPAAKPYSNYINWLKSRDHAASGAYWGKYLDGLHALTPICPVSANGNTYVAAHEVLSLPANLAKQLQEVAAANRVTLSTLLECAWGIILSRYNNTADVLFGKVVAGRPAEIEGIEHMVGLFINTVPSRITYNAGTSFAALLKQTQEQVLETEPHQYYALTEIQKANKSGNKLFDHIFAFENYPYENLAHTTGIELKNIEAFEQTNYDFNVVVAPGSSLTITFKYNSNLFDQYYVAGIKNAFACVLHQVSANAGISINNISLVDEESRLKLLETFSPAPTNYGVGTVTDLFRQQVQSTPHNVALRHRDEQLSYAELWQRSTGVAHELTRRGVQPQQIVAILIDRSVEMITGLLGILQSGAAFLPIDPDYPEERIRHILSDSQSKFVITSKKYAGKFNEAVELVFVEDIQPGSTAAVRTVAPGDLAYIIYTSGTTGLPNGVMISHQSLVNLCQWHKQYYGLTPADVSTKYAGFGFDATVWEIFPALLSGGSLYIIEDEIRYNLKALAENYTKHGVTISFLPTQLGEQFMQQETQCPSLQKLLLGGDKLKSMKPGLGYEVYNNYGPTENTVVATACKVAGDAGNIPIGKPIGTSQVYVLLPGSEQLQPIGVAGELCISGDSLARGYLGKPELTARKFVANPFVAGKRMYRTGDLARWLPDGNLEFLGRIDNQIKIRGYRIEPGEIETCLVSHPAVSEAAIVVRENNNGYNFLYAFYTGDATADALRVYVAEKLPAYMVPAHFGQLEKMPVNQNGKIDKYALQDLCAAHDKQPVSVEATNATQLALVKIWSKVLGIERVSITDSFFDLGGTSLDMIRVNDELARLYKTDNLLIQMFKYPTISALAAFLDGHTEAARATPIPAPKTENIKNNRLRQREKRRS